MQSSSNTGTVIQLAAGAIGSAWGYPGMMIGLSIGAFIAAKVAGGHNSNNNEDIKNTNFMTRLDNVPYVIGTAMSPGQLVWFGQLSLLDSATLRAGGYIAGTDYFSSYYRPLNSKFAVAFSSATNYARINRVFFDGKDKWNWCLWLADVVRWKASLKAYDITTPPFNIDINCNTQIESKAYLLTGVPHLHFCFMSYDGWFGDYSSFEIMSPNELSKALDGEDPYNSGIDFDFTKATTLQRFPNITAEISAGSLYTHEGFSNERLSSNNNSVIDVPDNRHSCRDGMHDYYYYYNWNYLDYTDYIFKSRFVRVHPIYGQTIIGTSTTTLPSLTLGVSHSMELSRTDEWLDRIYFLNGRLHYYSPNANWSEQRTYYAKYSLAYDLFYIDRKTLLPHSLKLDEKIYVSNFEGPATTIQIESMEVLPDYLLAFGWMTQDAFPLNYRAMIISMEDLPGGGKRIYLDLSGVPDGTFNGWFCWSTTYIYDFQNMWSTSLNGCPREIINQTTTYIDINRGFGFNDNALIGMFIYINYAQTWEAEYVVADLGSTSTMLVCNCPSSNIRNENDHFATVWSIYSNTNLTYRIDWSRTETHKNIYLLDALPFTPTPGQIFFVGFRGFYGQAPLPEGAVTLDREVVHRILPDRMQSRYEECKQMPWYWDDNWYQDQPPTTDGWRPAHVQYNDANLFVALKFDKETGEFLGLLNEASTYVRHIHAWGNAVQYTTSHESTIITCATDKQVFVHIACMQNATNGAVCEFVIDSETLAVSEDREWVSNAWGSGHAAGTFPVATAWLNTYDPITHETVKTWYALWYSYAEKYKTVWTFVNWTYVESQVMENDYSIFFSRLDNGSFNDPQKIFIRKVLYSGPLYAGWWFQGTTQKETRFIAKMGLENKLFIYFNHAWDGGNYSFGGYNETWVFEAPTEDSPQGNSRCIDQTGQDWLCTSGQGWGSNIEGFTDFNSTISTVISGNNAYQGGIRANSYHCDCNPITSIYNLLYYSEAAFGGWFNYAYDHPFSFNSYGEEIVNLFYDIRYTLYYYENNVLKSTQSYYPYTYTSAQTYCQQAVVAQVIINDQLVSYLEPRYQYSECISNAKPFYQIVKDIMQSCMGWVTLCQGKIRFVVPRQGETAEYYFGTEETGRVFTATQDSPAWTFYSNYGPDVPENVYGTDRNTSGIIYINVSNYPFNYFKGETGSFTFNGVYYEFVVVGNCWTNKIRIGIYNPSTLPPSWGYGSIPFTGVQFTIYRKDNIKEGSFVYGQKSKMGMPNITRLEFEDRTKNYITDISEVVSESLRQNDGYDKIQTYSMPGIKRATQAARVVQQLQDYLEFVEWTCGFETDIMGMHLCPGVIIGVSHAVTGWVNKLFRVMSLEETGDDFNMKLELEEYISGVYHDQGIPPIISGTGSGTGTSGWNSSPLPLDNFSILEDQTKPYLWIGYNSAGVQSNLVGVNVLRLNGSTWELVGTVLGVPTTMELAIALTDSKFDNQFISYTNPQGGSIPLSGYVWIGSELIEYNGVDTVNRKLMNLVRGVNDTPIASHSVGSLITVFGTATYIEFLESWVGLQQFKVTPIVYGVASLGEETSSPTVYQVIVGYAYKPHPPESLRLVEE